MKSHNWSEPLKVLDIENDKVKTNQGDFQNISGTSLKSRYTYIFKLEGDKIIETGMSTVDIIVAVPDTNGWKILSIKRGRPPFVGMWALPGGNIDEGEKPLDAAVRELEEETGLVIDSDNFYYVGNFDKLYRDPRNKNCISYAFVVALNEIPEVIAGDDATECQWNNVDKWGNINVDMAFDHDEIIKTAISFL
jgi:8-oxo-dGTP diphosphatase